MTLTKADDGISRPSSRNPAWKLSLGTLLPLIVLLPIVAHFAWGFGFSPVLSQSMQPAINAGDLEVTHQVAVRDVTVGDIVVLRDHESQTLFSHRVSKIDVGPQKITLTTKGDANPVIDRHPAVLDPSQQVPVIAATVPAVGSGVVFLSSPDGLRFGIALISISVFLLLFRTAVRGVAIRKRKREQSP
jgi:signal peptidase I